MASTKTRHSMVFLKDGANAAPACLAALRPEKVNRSGTSQSARVLGDEAAFKRNTYAVKEALARTGKDRPAGSNADPVSPDSVCKGVRVTLDNNSMWNECFRCRTEMILTKQGSRMFPYCRFRISGLQPCRRYALVMDIQPLDNSQYRWTGESWQVSKKAECQIRTNPFIHPESPATGQHWMQSPVSFYKLKLTNNVSDQEGNIILHPLHRYLPRLHLVETDKANDIRLSGPNVLTFSFPQTEFMTVTTYQNPQFAQLKVNFNPFAKGLKDDGLNSSGLKTKTNSGRELNKDGGDVVAEQHPVKKSLKVLLANHKPKCSKAEDANPSETEKNVTKTDHPAAVPGESPSSISRPAQKLISELICEAHVSLQRCSLEQRSSDDGSSLRATQSNTKTATSRHVGHTVGVSAPTRKRQTVETSRKSKDDKRPSDSGSSPAVIGRSRSGEAAPSAEPPRPSETTERQKRPARLPLPALALFLRQHSAKHKKSNAKPDSPPRPLPPESRVSAAASGPEATESCRPDPDVTPLNVPEPAARRPSSPPNPVAASDSVAAKMKSLSSEPQVFQGKAEMSDSAAPFCSVTVSHSTRSTSSEPPHLSPPPSSVLSAPNSPKTQTEETPVGTSSPPSDPMKTDSLLFDPECSSFSFDPLSPASSPEPLPPLPASLTLEMDSSSSVAASATESAQDPDQGKPSSVFRWHTVLPPNNTYVDATFATFQPPQQDPPLKSVTPPLLPCLNTSTSTDESAPSFQDSEPPLPFPAELSPLTLQLSLSPTFSSLDENGLSPAPSLSDLVHFFSTNVDIGIGGEFSDAEATPAPCPPPPAAETQEPPLQVQPAPARKPARRKKSKSTKLARLDTNQNLDDYRSLQPNLEEVEEQLFVSFASKEALKLHVADPCEETAPRPEPPPPDGQQAAEEPQNHAESQEEMIAAFQKILLKDLEVMKYRQVIHPVLQEVGLKMTLLDPVLSIDLQYLGVRLPIPPPGVGAAPLPPTPSPSEGSSAAFLSRTGKTTDVTQIKGWREKFTPSEMMSSCVSKPEAGPSSEPPKKNLSAFCSDMLDEYLENEAKLIDERAASFSQPPVEPPVFNLPVSSTSYVRTLDHVLKKQTAGLPALDLISGFIPPSKRPRLIKTKTCRKMERKLKGPKPNKPGLGFSMPESSPGAPKLPAVLTPDLLIETTQPQNRTTFKRRRKPTTLSQTLSPPKTEVPLPEAFEGLAPVESDSELAPTTGPKEDSPKKESRPSTTRALLRQKDLEDCVALEGRFRTSITEERAAIALTSLFTQTGFVSENPTAPIQLKRRRRFPCLNEFCRLGCICSSLSHSSRTSHCGRPSCMFGCSCLKQKVVLLKNLDSSDSSPTPHHGKVKKKRRRRRMKMAYVLKEAESVAQPAERVRTLWRKSVGAPDPEPVFVANMGSVSFPVVSRNVRSSCARVRGFRGKIQKRKAPLKDSRRVTRRAAGLQVQQGPKATTSGLPPAADKPPAESKPSKRLFIKADCSWESDADRTYVVKKLCNAMAREQLTKPFWIRHYFIVPADETVEGSGANRCIQYRVQITTPALQRGPAPVKLATQGRQTELKAAAQKNRYYHLKWVPSDLEPPKDWLKEKAEPLEEQQQQQGWQNGVLEETETVPVEDWQKEVIEEAEPDRQKGAVRKLDPVEDRQKGAVKKLDPVEDRQKGAVRKLDPVEDRQKRAVRKLDPVEDRQKGAVRKLDPVKDRQKGAVRKLDLVEDRQKGAVRKLDPVEDRQKGAVRKLDPVEDRQKGAVRKLDPVEDRQKGAVRKLDPVEDRQKGAVRKLDPVEDRQKGAVRKLDPVEDRQKEAVEKLDPVEDWQKEIEESDVEEERSTEDDKLDKKNDDIVLPLLKEVSPAGVLSTKQPGGTAHLLQVNEETCRPADRLVGHLTDQVGSQTQQQASTRKSSGLTPHTASSAAAAASTDPTSLHPLVTQVAYISPLPDSKPQNLALSSPAPSLLSAPPKNSKVMLIPAPGPLKTISLSHLPQVLPVQSSAGQRIILHQIQPTSGAQFYRRPDGKLVQLIPIRNLKPVKMEALPQTVLPASPSLTTLIVPSSSSSLSPASSSSSVVPLAAPVPPQSVFVANRSPCTVEPLGSNKDPALVTPPSTQAAAAAAPRDPATTPVNLISAKPSGGLEAKAVSVASSPKVVVVGLKTASQKSHPPPTETRPPSKKSDQELARNRMDLEIVSVDEETGLFLPEKRAAGVVDLASSSDTENSSDFRESDSEEEKKLHANSSDENQETDLDKTAEQITEKRRRVQLQQMFSLLKKEVGHDETKMSKQSTLMKATELIQELRCREDALKRKKRWLRRRRDEYISLLTPSSADQIDDDDDDVVEVVDSSDDVIEVSSDEEKPAGSEPNPTTVSKAADDAAGGSREEEDAVRRMSNRMDRTKSSKGDRERNRAVTNIPKSPRRLLPHQETEVPQREVDKLKSFKSSLNHKEVVASGEEKLQLWTKQEVNEEEEHQETNEPPAGGGLPVASPTEDTKNDITPSDPQWMTQTPPPRAVGVSNSVPAHPSVSHDAPGAPMRPKTVPNILARSKNPPEPSPLNKPKGPTRHILAPSKVLSLVRETLHVSPVIVGPTVLKAVPPPAVVSSSLPLLAQTGSTRDRRRHHQTQPGPDGPSPLLLPSRNREPSQTLRPASSHSPGPRTDTHSDLHPGGPDPRQDPESESLSSLLDEIVFLNQKAVATATRAQRPEQLSCQDSGGAGEQTGSPWSRLRQLDSVDPGLTETGNVCKQPGLDSVNTNCGVLAPPPLLHMKMGGAKAGGPTRSEDAAGDGVGSARGGGGVGWRPMPRLVPLGVRGNSPS